ncbi:hypothetical protein SAMN05428949_5684 [Chitinophaga sp. YR627]|uniref:SDR family NAD(P)-dependent oxidoreductase n=1 Tax=Chitinophaga sp. YR627 TaxID=1881041 RepID=UPI0008EC995A|nr:SDR family oxidoreductase [Chitinophaga sp. YR627]SFO54678.1 hypothetical protein SAMN05428949_5684 [Chitinophaga sp. YR627]
MKVTLITGASAGIGEAIARQIAGQKENVVLVARSEQSLQLQCKTLTQQFGIKADYIAADLCKPESVAFVYQTCRERGYEVESLINNAGMGSGGELIARDLQHELNMMLLNMNAMVSLTHYFLKDMAVRKRGNIVNIGSLLSFIPAPYMAVYCATKAFVRSFTRALHEEAKTHGVHVLLFCPGLTDSNFIQGSYVDDKTAHALTAGVRAQTPEQVAAEFIKAYKEKRKFAISGGFNRFGAKILSILSDATIARQTGKTYRKRMLQ